MRPSFPDRMPAHLPARFTVVDCDGAPAHVFALHMEHGHLLQKEDGTLHEGYVRSARLNGLANVHTAAFGIFHVVVGGHCARPEARELVEAWARVLAAVLGEIAEKCQAALAADRATRSA